MSPLSEFTEGHFQEVIGDAARPSARRVVISSGKLHWELSETREKTEADGPRLDVALIRLEQLYPFPAALPAPGTGAVPRRSKSSGRRKSRKIRARG